MIYCRLSFLGSGRNTSVPMKGDPLSRLAYRWNIFSKQMQDKGSVKVFSAVRFNLGSVYYTPVLPVPESDTTTLFSRLSLWQTASAAAGPGGSVGPQRYLPGKSHDYDSAVLVTFKHSNAPSWRQTGPGTVSARPSAEGLTAEWRSSGIY